jgi:hypothetical protein
MKMGAQKEGIISRIFNTLTLNMLMPSSTLVKENIIGKQILHNVQEYY